MGVTSGTRISGVEAKDLAKDGTTYGTSIQDRNPVTVKWKDDRRLTIGEVEVKDFARDDAAISAEFYGARPKEVAWVDDEETAYGHKER